MLKKILKYLVKFSRKTLEFYIFIQNEMKSCYLKFDWQAIDPEGDTVFYSIVSGNDLRQFAVGGKSGIITVIRKLDREDLTRYQLVSFSP